MKKIEMTTGSIPKKILQFSLPMIVGSIFQLTYSTIDGIVIGRFIDKSALAAVGAATPIFNILLFLLVGLCNGASILMSELFAQKKPKTLKQNIGTSISAGSILSIILTILIIVFARPILKATGVKTELLTDATNYLIFVSIGLVFSFINNIYTAALRSTGDSLRPLYILALTSVINIGLDFAFVLGFKMGVIGAAIATSISMALSAIICIFYAAYVDDLFKFKLSDFKIVKPQLIETSKYAIASALQQIVLFIGKSIVQISINTLSIDAQAAFTAASKIDDYAITPIQCFGNTAAMFIAQNRGAHKPERCKKGLFTGMILSVIYASIACLVVYFGNNLLVKMFLDSEDNVAEVIEEGAKYYQYMAFFYFFPALTNSVQSYFRGFGKLNIVFYSTTVQIIFRASSSFFLIKSFEITGAALCTGVGWTFMLLFEVPILIYYLRTKKGLNHTSSVDVIKYK